MIAIWKKNGLRIRVLAQVQGRFGEDRLQVQKETAQGIHGIFSLKLDEIKWVE